ncbi:hypothetical protein A9168_08370 [Macellibacteroides sp. HH-ZS]|nr:hypothetical protein A9168_08370 [Macellibacteroides sp. HH-ZS]
MPSWSDIYSEINLLPQANKFDALNKKTLGFLDAISKKTERNIISYYSSFLNPYRQDCPDHPINDNDKNALMQAVYNLDKSKGLDLVLHTPGGDIAATESIIDYLHSIFNGNIRAIIPQMAMSAGSMIALSCNSIMMGKQSCLGPIDPQLGGVACGAVIGEFEKAKNEISTFPASIPLWQVIISKYTPTFLISCQKALDWSETLADKWIKEPNPDKKLKIIKAFTDHEDSKTHSRHFSKDKCKELGLNIEDMESDQELQDLILSLHHCYMIMLDITAIAKAVQNNIGASYLRLYPQSGQ